jgi:hypothetical protein
MGEPETPDIYTDAITLSAGAYGYTVTLYRSSPPIEATQENPGEMVGRIRMSPALAEAFVNLLVGAIAQTERDKGKP